jgi:hypothetical protein
MPSPRTFAATLKRLLGRRARTNALRGTWRDRRAAPSHRHATGTPGASAADMPPGFYRSEAFAEDLIDSDKRG